MGFGPPNIKNDPTPLRRTPEHSCYDVHAKNCGCDDCLLDATSELFRSFSTKQDLEVRAVTDKFLSPPFKSCCDNVSIDKPYNSCCDNVNIDSPIMGVTSYYII